MFVVLSTDIVDNVKHAVAVYGQEISTAALSSLANGTSIDMVDEALAAKFSSLMEEDALVPLLWDLDDYAKMSFNFPRTLKMCLAPVDLASLCCFLSEVSERPFTWWLEYTEKMAAERVEARGIAHDDVAYKAVHMMECMLFLTETIQVKVQEDANV